MIRRSVFAVMGLVGLFVALPGHGAGAAGTGERAAATTFSNPVMHSSDPWILRYGGSYYFTGTDGCDAGYLCVWQSATITGLGSATKYDAFRIPACPAPNCAQAWAPEIHAINGHFYLYYAADDGADTNHRIFVADAASPTGPYAESNTGYPHGQLHEASNLWAIDPDVFQTADGRLYATWSGWPTSSGGKQDVYLAPMSDPLHLSGGRVQISAPTEPWETVGFGVDEGPVGFQHGGKTYIAYSASFCATSSYAVGLLTNTDGNLLSAGSWAKTGPHFKFHSGVNAPASFVPTQSPDGTEDWFLVHSNTNACDPGRVIRAQRLYWDTDGTPLLGYPVGDGVPLTPPSGELGSTGSPNPFTQGWGSAFGDAAEGVANGGRLGSWTVTGPTGADLTSFGGTAWTRLFRASNPNYEKYTVTADTRWLATGTTSAYPKYGVYACYDDRNNHVEVFIDRKYMVLATHAVVQGTEQAWQNAALPAGFDPTQYHRLTVVKSGATFTFSLDGKQLQQRTFSGTFPVLLNGQVGLVTEDTQASYRNVTISNTQ
jgi:GH43 family beta-xylosidase